LQKTNISKKKDKNNNIENALYETISEGSYNLFEATYTAFFNIYKQLNEKKETTSKLFPHLIKQKYDRNGFDKSNYQYKIGDLLDEESVLINDGNALYDFINSFKIEPEKDF